MTTRTIAPARVNPALLHPHEQRLALDGVWQFRLDPEDHGVTRGWHENPHSLTDEIVVPGCWQGQGFGSDEPEVLRDFLLKAEVFPASYRGAGWYGKMFDLPAGWKGRRVWLLIGGAHPSAELWLNGARLGEMSLPFVPFGFEMTNLVASGEPNWLAVRVHEKNREFGLAYSWQGCWSGLYRNVELTATGLSFIQHCAIYPEVEGERLRLRARIGDAQMAAGALTLRVSACPLGDESAPVAGEFPATGDMVEAILPVPSPRLWSPDNPNLHRADVALVCEDQVLDALSERVGFVSIVPEGKQILINGEPYYMRGSGDFISCPETGCPDSDRDRWRKKLAALRAYGYNYVRCQSYVYTPEYFDAADEVGLLVQSEMGMLGAWGGHSHWHTYQWPKPTPDNYPILKRQWDLVVARDVNHPSASIYCMSNEWGREPAFPLIAWQCYRDTKAMKPAALVIWTDGGYHPDMPGDFVNDAPERDDKVSKPLIVHEFKWWSAYPDVRIASKYSGAVRPYAAEIAREAAARHGLEHLLPQFADASQRLQFLEAKAKMEICRRDYPRLAGICHFDAMDANPAPMGVIDEFYEHKYADSAAWLQTTGDTAILCSLGFEDRVVRADETFRCSLFISDFSHPPYRNPVLRWELGSGAEALAHGELTPAHTPFFTCPAGQIEAALPAVSTPLSLTLHAALREGDREVTNSWQLWLFPAEAPMPQGARLYGQPRFTWAGELTGVPPVSADGLASAIPGPVIAERLDEALLSFIRAGGRVILAASEGLVRPHPPNFGYVRYFFTPPANYPPYEDGQNGTIILRHPMLGDFPHDGVAEWQFFRMIENAPPLDLEPLGLTGADPVIRVIHRYPVCRPLGYLAEAAFGRGGLMLCALDMRQEFAEARYLLAQICAYAAGEDFRPAMSLSAEEMQRITGATALLQARESAAR
jgi:hypothetical protein